MGSTPTGEKIPIGGVGAFYIKIGENRFLNMQDMLMVTVSWNITLPTPHTFLPVEFVT